MRFFAALLASCLLLGMGQAIALDDNPTASTDALSRPNEAELLEAETVTTLLKIQQSINEVKRTLDEEKAHLKRAETPEEGNEIRAKIDQVNKELNALKFEFESVAAQVDASALGNVQLPNRTITEELTSLIQPILTEARRATDGMRQKADLISSQEQLEGKLAVAMSALKNINRLMQLDTPPAVSDHLVNLRSQWQKRVDRAESQLAANRQQLKLLDKTHGSLMGTLRDNIHEFVQTRGLYLLGGVGAFFIGSLLLRLFYRLLNLIFPALGAKQRSFRVRVFQLTYFTISAVISGLLPALVFYWVEDWLLFSLTLLIMFGLFWSARTALSQAWRQALLFLNIGPVREGERIMFDGLPWQVSSINLYSRLDNPVSGLRIRLPLTDLLSLTSRPIRQDEPWFVGQVGDWLMFKDGYFGQISAISYELVELLDLAGSSCTMPTKALVDSAPKNLSSGTFITSYLLLDFKHQKQVSQEIPQKMIHFLQQRVEQLGLQERIRSVNSEFSAIRPHGLEVATFLDLNGIYAREYFRLGRVVQRAMIDAANEHGWTLSMPPVKMYTDQPLSSTPPPLSPPSA